MSTRAGYARSFHRGFRPVGRRALRFIAFHEILRKPSNMDPEGPYPYGPGRHERFIAGSGPSGDGPSGLWHRLGQSNPIQKLHLYLPPHTIALGVKVHVIRDVDLLRRC